MPTATSRRSPDPAVRVGPSWSDPPQWTLGWSVLDYLRRPDGATSGEQWVYTPEQVRLLLWWYAVDERGRFIYRRGVLARDEGLGQRSLCGFPCRSRVSGPEPVRRMGCRWPAGVVGDARRQRDHFADGKLSRRSGIPLLGQDRLERAIPPAWSRNSNVFPRSPPLFTRLQPSRSSGPWGRLDHRQSPAGRRAAVTGR